MKHNHIKKRNSKKKDKAYFVSKSELLYRMSRDGIEYSTFHNLCDNKGATITLIKLEDGKIKGKIKIQCYGK